MGERRTVLLLRHAKAEKRRDWDGPDPLRALSPAGVEQARKLAGRLRRWDPAAILTSPALRCRQTVAPLARALRLPATACDELREGEPVAKAAERVLAAGGATLLVCSHGDVLAELGGALEDRGVRVEHAPLPEPPDVPAPSSRLAVLDLGSTSFHLLVADVSRAGHVRPVDREKTMLRLGAVIAEHGHIPEAVASRVLDAADALARVAQRAGAERLLPVATAALRDARDGRALARRIGERIGAPVRILPGEEEARLIFRAFGRRVLLPSGPTLGVDLGGGSLELALGTPEGLELEATLRLGVTRLAHELVEHDPMRGREVRAVVERTREALHPVAGAIRRARPAMAVAAGGTARALGHLGRGLRGIQPVATVNEVALGLDELRTLTEVLVRARHDERLALPGIRRRRADLLPTGALVLLTVAEALELDGYTLCDWGVREGVLLEEVAPEGR